MGGEGEGEADRDLKRSPRLWVRDFRRELPTLTMCSSASSFSLCKVKEKHSKQLVGTLILITSTNDLHLLNVARRLGKHLNSRYAELGNFQSNCRVPSTALYIATHRVYTYVVYTVLRGCSVGLFGSSTP